jgi:hypothetical protein
VSAFVREEKGIMRFKISQGAWLLLAALAFSPGVASAQQYAPSDNSLPAPLGSTRPEDGGFFAFGGPVFYRQTNPLKAQAIAFRGFKVTGDRLASSIAGVTFDQFGGYRDLLAQLGLDERFATTNDIIPFGVPADLLGGLQTFTITDANGNQTILFPIIERVTDNTEEFYPVGTFLGSGAEALNVNQLTGQETYQPGFEVGAGWKFKNGSSIYLSWLFITQAHYRAGATLVPRGNSSLNDPLNAEAYLYSPVFNIPPALAGSPNKVANDSSVGGQAVFGIWNGAAVMTIDFLQRTQQWEIVYREPILEMENYRLSGLVGPRFFWIWERFRWRTTSLAFDLSGGAPEDTGIYSAVTSNRMYGVHAGCEQEFYLGHGFALSIKTEGALLLNTVKERVKYETAAKYLGLPENKRARREWSLVPEVNASVGMMWYPTESVQVNLGYEVMGFMNTLAARRPVSFDFANPEVKWSKTSRLFDGFRGGIAFWF